MLILHFLGLAGDSATPPGLRDVQAALERMDPQRARYYAAFAYILGRVAAADDHVGVDEGAVIRQALEREAGMSAEQAALVAEMAHRPGGAGEIEDHLVSREFVRLGGRDQQLQLLNCLFAVAAAEGQISREEEEEIRQIARELEISERDMITVRYRYLRNLKGRAAKA